MSSDQVNFVESILREAADKDEAAVKSIAVEKEVPVVFDLGHVMLSDPNLIPAAAFRAETQQFLDTLARDNAQLLVNEIWKQEKMHVEGSTIAKLPDPVTRLPRSKLIPKPKPPTKWEQFAKRKGIQQKTKDKLVFDEESGEWKPRFGYRSKDNQMEEWAVEAKGDEGPEEAFAVKKKEKKERTSKNEYQRLKNVARAVGRKVANNTDAVIPEEGNVESGPVPMQLEKAARLAKSSTASLGKFQDKAVNEKPVKGQGGKKRQFEGNEVNVGEEKCKNLKLMDEILKQKPKINVKKAIIHQEIVSCLIIFREQSFYL